MGKLAVAVYAIAMINVVASLLKPGRVYLEDLCRVPAEIKKAKPKPSLFETHTAISMKKEM